MADNSPAVLITGASSGIGLTSADYLSHNGFSVYAGVRKEADADRIRTEYNGRITPIIIDVTDPASRQNAYKEMQKAVGENGLYGLVNNAAISLGCPLEYADEEHLQSQFNTNVFGPMLTINQFMPLLRKAKGRILNVSSGAGLLSIPINGAYSATKSALQALSDALRVELKQSDIEVSVIVPGAIDTPIHGKGESALDASKHRMSEEGMARYGKNLEVYETNMKKLSENASDPVVIGKAMLAALTDRKPKAYYSAGSGTEYNWIMRFLSSRVKDKIVAKMTGF